jgi:Uma2 family endonuclease
MTIALRQPMTVDAFLAWEGEQEERWEFDGFQPVAMVGGTSARQLIAGNLHARLWQRLRGSPCRAYREGMKIRPANSVRYPDVFVTCSPVANTAKTADNPVVVFEVLSPGTASTDIVVKSREYQATPSIVRYVMLAQDSVGATVHERRGEEWLVTAVTDPSAVLAMPEIGVRLVLGDLYEGVIERPATNSAPAP